MIIRSLLFSLFVAGVLSANAQYKFIEEVLEYTPAPGQFINTPPWGMPESAESIIGTITGSLTLGAWGGYVVFRFEEAVQNHPDNPFGIDFIIFGNPTSSWAEPGSVWVMKDENGNGIPDDTWYQLAGSDYHFSSTLHNYEVTYFNPGSDHASDISWQDNQGNSGVIPVNPTHGQSYYPDSVLFPHISSDQFTHTGSRIAGGIDRSIPNFTQSRPRAFGYADNTPRKSAPFNIPNNPYTKEIENAGGDGFDISWAVDGEGNYVDLDEIDFIKVQTAMLDHGGWLGEVSAEITGAVVVEPNPDLTGQLDMIVIKDLPHTIDLTPYPLEAFAFHKGRLQTGQTILWTTNMEDTFVDNDGFLHFSQSGEVTLTAHLESNPDISTSVSTVLQFTPTHIQPPGEKDFMVFPNPASEFITIKTGIATHFKIMNMQGKVIRHFSVSEGSYTIDIGYLDPGIYILSGVYHGGVFQKKIIVR